MTENEKRLGFMFDEALQLRDSGDLVASRHLLASLIAQLRPEDKVLLSHAHMQLGNIFWKLGDQTAREAHFRAALVVRPAAELASLGLFHALLHQDRISEALQEMVRLLRLRYSEMYSELLTPRFGKRLAPEHRRLIAEARRLLAKRRRN